MNSMAILYFIDYSFYFRHLVNSVSRFCSNMPTFMIVLLILRGRTIFNPWTVFLQIFTFQLQIITFSVK